MKIKKIALLFFTLFVGSSITKAQDNFENFLLLKKEDATKLLEGYFNPVMKGLISSMNNGWYHTAKVHKIAGFDLTIGANLSIVPEKDKIFKAIGLTSVIPSSLSSPTFVGTGNGESITVNRTVTISDPNSPVYNKSQKVTATAVLPKGEGSNLPGIPAPVVQFSFGLPKKIEVMTRFIPSTNIKGDEVNVNLLGIGLKKEITNWILVTDKLPLHISLLAAYSTINVNYKPTASSNEIKAINPSAAFSLRTFTVQAIASLNFPFINFYGGIGYGSGNSTIKINGNYTRNFDYSIGTTNYQESLTLGVPSDLNFNSSSFRTTIGTRLSLGFFKIFGSYTLQEYSTLNAGIAFSFR